MKVADEKHERKSTIWQKYKYNDTKRWVEIVNLKKKNSFDESDDFWHHIILSYKILSLINFVKISIRNGFIKGWIYRTLDLIIVIRKYRTINFISKKWVSSAYIRIGGKLLSISHTKYVGVRKTNVYFQVLNGI